MLFIVKIVHLVSGARIRRHNFSIISLLLQPLNEFVKVNTIMKLPKMNQNIVVIYYKAPSNWKKTIIGFGSLRAYCSDLLCKKQALWFDFTSNVTSFNK